MVVKSTIARFHKAFVYTVIFKTYTVLYVIIEFCKITYNLYEGKIKKILITATDENSWVVEVIKIEFNREVANTFLVEFGNNERL